ncbi:gluconate 2-dehydrogenase subunit 3 family protein [Thalassomonas haliotis]|uniref:Gluconate 2-dehydrogenase subunit 3 family protein n=1 Tax=Thalassomonas haliotis TaxID=485448 RepID=A0ABY7VCD5_9GAMM|nr:gluconate 2-dehydrogenase subunit 3 family protein [Thalassomonas haliotis]WDE11062.1 gluconate 2-dehydrogenase subunit 3 family protein [Thalassomonas haliotis]
MMKENVMDNAADQVTDKLTASETLSQVDTSRRRAMKQLTALFGGALSMSSISLAVQGYQAQKDIPGRTGKILNPQQLNLLRILVGLIIPATETPSASDVDVHGFIDNQLAFCFSKEEQLAFIRGLEKLQSTAVKQLGQAFAKCHQAQQVDLLNNLLSDLEDASGDFDSKDKDFFYRTKSLTLLGYYTSEIGATRELAYLPIPGGYRGNVPFDEVGKAWALN